MRVEALTGDSYRSSFARRYEGRLDHLGAEYRDHLISQFSRHGMELNQVIVANFIPDNWYKRFMGQKDHSVMVYKFEESGELKKYYVSLNADKPFRSVTVRINSRVAVPVPGKLVPKFLELNRNIDHYFQDGYELKIYRITFPDAQSVRSMHAEFQKVLRGSPVDGTFSPSPQGRNPRRASDYVPADGYANYLAYCFCGLMFLRHFFCSGASYNCSSIVVHLLEAAGLTTDISDSSAFTQLLSYIVIAFCTAYFSSELIRIFSSEYNYHDGDDSIAIIIALLSSLSIVNYLTAFMLDTRFCQETMVKLFLHTHYFFCVGQLQVQDSATLLTKMLSRNAIWVSIGTLFSIAIRWINRDQIIQSDYQVGSIEAPVIFLMSFLVVAAAMFIIPCVTSGFKTEQVGCSRPILLDTVLSRMSFFSRELGLIAPGGDGTHAQGDVAGVIDQRLEEGELQPQDSEARPQGGVAGAENERPEDEIAEEFISVGQNIASLFNRREEPDSTVSPLASNDANLGGGNRGLAVGLGGS